MFHCLRTALLDFLLFLEEGSHLNWLIASLFYQVVFWILLRLDHRSSKFEGCTSVTDGLFGLIDSLRVLWFIVIELSSVLVSLFFFLVVVESGKPGLSEYLSVFLVLCARGLTLVSLIKKALNFLQFVEWSRLQSLLVGFYLDSMSFCFGVQFVDFVSK